MNGAKGSAGRLQHRLPPNLTVCQLPMLPETGVIALSTISALETQHIDPEVAGCSHITRADRDPAPGS